MIRSEELDLFAVARLDGFLSGLAVFGGNIRDYSANAYLVDASEGSVLTEDLRRHYTWSPDLHLAEPVVLFGGARELEESVGHYAVRAATEIDGSRRHDLMKYTSFRIMERIAEASGGLRARRIFRVESIPAKSRSDLVFFCLEFEKRWMVLQFNNNIGFVPDELEMES